MYDNKKKSEIIKKAIVEAIQYENQIPLKFKFMVIINK